MIRRFGNDGFSLTEVLIATGILTVGFVLIAGTFPVGIKLTALATERTIGAVAADEAFAKIQLYGFRSAPSSWPPLNPSDPNTACVDYAYVASPWFWANEFAYPSTDTGDEKKYYWSAICRHIVKTGDVQVTVFVSRTMGTNVSYPYWNLDEVPPSWQTVGYPRPVLVKVDVPMAGGLDILDIIVEDDGDIDTNLARAEYVSEGAVLVEAVSGQIMRVLERDGVRVKLAADMVLTDKFDGWLWVIPPSVRVGDQPPAVTGRYPCVGVYQRVLVQ